MAAFKKEYMVLDTETTGFDQGNYLIQLAYAIYDEDHKLIHKECMLVNEDGVEMQDYFKKYTLAEIQEIGISPAVALETLRLKISNCCLIVCHNASYDIDKVLLPYFSKYNINIQLPKIVCTMKESTAFCGLRNPRYPTSIKWPKLVELHEKCFGVSFSDDCAHSADFDVEMTAKCFAHLCKTNIMSV